MSNQSSPWIYAAGGTLEFLVEAGTSFIPLDMDVIRLVVEANLEGNFFMLERLKGPGVTGRSPLK